MRVLKEVQWRLEVGEQEAKIRRLEAKLAKARRGLEKLLKVSLPCHLPAGACASCGRP